MANITRGDANDLIRGTENDDIINAGGGNDKISARDGNDVINAGDGDDFIQPQQGFDTVIAGRGNDTIQFIGDDILIGVDPNNGAGRGEIDIFKENGTSVRFGLRQRAGSRETFVLGNGATAFYVGEGNNDFARIENFNPDLDRVQLHGFAEQYEIRRLSGVSFSGTGLFFEDDLIAGFKEISRNDLSLASDTFTFVGNDSNNDDPTDIDDEPDDGNNAGVIQELENNNTLQNAQNFGAIDQTPITVVGNLKSESRIRPDEDRFDIFKVEITEPSQFNVQLTSNDEKAASVSLVRDFNNDGRSNFNDLIRPSDSNGPDQFSYDRLDPGTYFVRVSAKSGSVVDYELEFNAPPIETARLNLNLNELIPLDLGRNDPNPIRFEAEIGDQVFEQRFEENFERTTLTADIDVNQREIPIKVRAFRLNADGSETQFDIGNGPERGDLEFDATYDTLTKKLFKVGAFPSVNEGQTLRKIARRDGADGRFALNVTFDTFSEGQQVPALTNIQSAATGSRQADSLTGTAANGRIDGKGGDDVINTGGGDDIALGGGGRDTLIGGAGNDLVEGGYGKDELTGVNPEMDNAGFGEVDQLTGNKGGDRFYLGDAKQAYYLGQGADDYALITDFSIPEGDILQLHGTAEAYTLGVFAREGTIGVGISTSDTGDLIGVVANNQLSQLSLTDTSVFEFVG